MPATSDALLDEGLGRQHGLPPGALPTALRALRQWVLAQLASGRSVRLAQLGSFLWLPAAPQDAPGRSASVVSAASSGRGRGGGEQLVFALSDALVHAGRLRLGRGLARGASAAAARGVVEEPNHTQLSLT